MSGAKMYRVSVTFVLNTPPNSPMISLPTPAHILMISCGTPQKYTPEATDFTIVLASKQPPIDAVKTARGKKLTLRFRRKIAMAKSMVIKPSSNMKGAIPVMR
jgi:hypothetical protein